MGLRMLLGGKELVPENVAFFIYGAKFKQKTLLIRKPLYILKHTAQYKTHTEAV
jgi:hypothetical protein